ncbi:endoplasmic reticulum Ca-transporting P-type ATPase [Punctularia strigosozonata HHB-11173 SS5]|uniref:endoplasmic reticulum Ca-transporting P-type ATPase n=1 Tax=Punctularia strigosozonata (strain HHB-11173) TaxID=741275 RepID=UPI000441712D|nr:endoplasmic reticulum Ca-transporting P-type ATPase [Punctularia strigosozonata HHB-11173 SS5]EIN05518.1 endoplasmic reticulum Ca-transporting P-type ATPase [Punctularia strigosozonata HHB-11173 SS5]
MASVSVESPEIAAASLRVALPFWTHLYAAPFLALYPLWAYAYFIKYDTWIQSEEWTFVGCVLLGAGHALSFLVTRWNAGAKAWVTTKAAKSLEQADCIRIIPNLHRGEGEIVSLVKKVPSDPLSYSFNYQRDTYVLLTPPPSTTFGKLPYPSSRKPPLSTYQVPKGLTSSELASAASLYGKNEFNIPVPSFLELFGEHATAPFFVFQIFCVALWCLDEYWYYSLFTLFMLVVFECTTVTQRLNTLKEFRTMSITPFPIQCLRNAQWTVVQTDELLPGDVVSIVRQQNETSVPADILLVKGSCIVNEAMLSGESTPLLKESIQLLEGDEKLDVDGQHRNAVLFSGTKVLQATPGGDTPDGGCLGVVLRTGFGTAQGQLVRTMIFSTERVSANNLESFLFIGFLLIFAIAASWYVWVKGIERGLKKSKLLLDCVLIVTSVVPPELPMELSLAVNASLVALSKFAIFCTEPFRIPFAGRVDVCCFDKTGTITAENLVVEGVAGVDVKDPLKLVDVKETTKETTLCLAAAHALVRLDDGTVVGDPMEKTTLEALKWKVDKGDTVSPEAATNTSAAIRIRRRFQFSSALKRMSTVSSLPNGRTLIAVKGAPETIKGMLSKVPEGYDDTFKWFTRRGSRVLALGVKEGDSMSVEKINKLPRDQVENGLTFAGFLVFHCPLKADAVQALQMLADSSHRCIMITGDNPLTAVHVAKDVEIVDRDALILDLKENAASESDLVWRTVDDSKSVPVNPAEPLDTSLFDEYDVCITGPALKQYENREESLHQLVQNTWVYARVSPSQKELILNTLRVLGYTTLMAGDGTNDVGALKQAHIGVALLDGTPEDLQKIAEHQRLLRMKKVYESQLKLTQRFNQPPPPVPPALAQAFPELVQTQQQVAQDLQVARQRNPAERFDLSALTEKMSEMDEEDVPKIKLGDASCAAPFTSKLSNVSAITSIIRQGRCTLVATIQMYKILALNCLITAYSLSVQYLDGIKYGDYQVTITGMLMSVCFLCISRAKPVEKLSRERPLGNIFNFYVLLSVLLQFALHIVTMVYITNLAHSNEERGPIDLDAKFEPSLLNTAIYLLGLSQQVSTFAINYQGRPFRESIRENKYLYWGLVGAQSVAVSGATDFMPELNRWLQIVEMPGFFKFRLSVSMALDFVGCYIIEKVCKYFFADLEPKPLVTRGRERREQRRAVQEKVKAEEAAKAAAAETEKKVQ